MAYLFNPFTGKLDRVIGVGDLLPGGTANLILFVDSSGNLAQDSDLLFDQSTNELRLGGASTQGGKLILRTAATDTYGIYIDGTTTPNTTGIGAGVRVGQTYSRTALPFFTTMAGMSTQVIDSSSYSTGSNFASWTHTGIIQSLSLSRSITANNSSLTENNYGLSFGISNIFGTHTSPSITFNNIGVTGNISSQPTFNNAGGTYTENNTGFNVSLSALPTLTAGTLTVVNKGLNIDITGNTVGTSTNYGIYLNTITGADANWGIYDNAGASHYLKGDTIIGATATALGSSKLTLYGDMYIAPASNNKINFDRTNTSSYGRLLYLTGGTEAYGLGQRGDDSNDYFSLTGPAANSFPRIFTVIPGSGAVPSNTSTFNFSTAANPSHTFKMDGATVLNEQGTSTGNLRVETDNYTSAIQTDAANDRVGFFTSPSYPVEFKPPSSLSPYYINVMFTAPGSNDDISIGLTSTRLSTTQRWFFGSGSGATPNTNNFRIYDLNNFREGINIIPSSSGPTIVIDSDKTSTAAIVLSAVAGTPTVFNEQGMAQDFRIEADTDANCFFLSGTGSGFIGLGTNTQLSSEKLSISKTGNSAFNDCFTVLAPSNTTAGNRACFNIGVANSAKNLATFAYRYAGSGSTSNAFDVFFHSSSNPVTSFFASGDAGVGLGASSTPSARWHIISTTEQLRVGYDTSNYYSKTVSSTGSVTHGLTGTSPTHTFTQKIVPNVTAITSSSTPTPNCDTTQLYDVTALAVGATFGAPTGTPVNGQKLIIRIKDNGGAQTLAWNAVYVAGGVALPTTTVAGKIMQCGLIYNTANSLNKWMLVALAQES